MTSRTPGAVAAAAALLLAVASLAACGRRSSGGGGQGAAPAGPQAPSAQALESEARRHLDESERLLRAAAAMRGDGDECLVGGSASGARETYVEAGRLYEAAAEERNQAYAAAVSAREARAAAAHARCRARRAAAEEPSPPGR